MEIQSDHDLLVTMHEQLKQVRIDIQKLNDGTSSTLSDHEKRLRTLEDNRQEDLGRNKWISATWAVVSSGIIVLAEYFLTHR